MDGKVKEVSVSPGNVIITDIVTSVLLKNTPLVKFTRNYIRDSSGVISIFSLVKISMITDIKFVS